MIYIVNSDIKEDFHERHIYEGEACRPAAGVHGAAYGLSMLVNSLYNIVDSFFVAQISEQAMTALSLVYPVQNMINAVAIGFGIGINARVSYHLGAGDKKWQTPPQPTDFFCL